MNSFSTATAPAGERIARWEAHVSEAVMGLRCRTLADRDFSGATVNAKLDRTRLSRVRADTAHVIERAADLIRSSPENSIVGFFVLAGDGFFHHSKGIRTLRPGQLVICDSDEPFIRGFSDCFKELFVKVPRQVFVEQTGRARLDAPVFTAFGAAKDPVATRLVSVIERATRERIAEMPDEAELVGLLSAVISPREPASGTAYFSAAKGFIEHRLGDRSLSAVTIAAAVGISPRHLSRVFADAGSTVPQYVLGRRLDVARALLQRNESDALSVAEVAIRCGFTSSAHFSHAFVDRFGERASTVRRRSAQGRALDPTGAEIGHRFGNRSG